MLIHLHLEQEQLVLAQWQQETKTQSRQHERIINRLLQRLAHHLILMDKWILRKQSHPQSKMDQVNLNQALIIQLELQM